LRPTGSNPRALHPRRQRNGRGEDIVRIDRTEEVGVATTRVTVSPFPSVSTRLVRTVGLLGRVSLALGALRLLALAILLRIRAGIRLHTSLAAVLARGLEVSGFDDRPASAGILIRGGRAARTGDQPRRYPRWLG
jgi:hypothetical protein